MKILIIRFSSLGDVILTTPVFSAIRRAHPAAEACLVTRDDYAGLFDGDPRLSRVLRIEREADRAQLTSVKWDFVIDLQNSRRSKRLRRHLSAIAAPGVFRKLYVKRLLLMCLRVNAYTGHDHVARRYLAAASRVTGAAAQPNAPAIIVNCESHARATEAVASLPRPLLALFPFSAWKNKQWPGERFAEVARHFLGEGWGVVIMGGPHEREAAGALGESLGAGCRSVAGELSLAENACVLSRCELALGNDTGLSHLARARGVKTGVVYGSTTRHLGFFPYGEPAFRVFEEHLWCRPCHLHGGNVCVRGSRPCLGRVSAQRVIAGLTELHAGRGGGRGVQG